MADTDEALARATELLKLDYRLHPGYDASDIGRPPAGRLPGVRAELIDIEPVRPGEPVTLDDDQDFAADDDV